MRKKRTLSGPMCAREGCLRHLYSTNTTGFCEPHSGAAKWAQEHGQAPTCPVEGCGKRLQRDNRSGYCRPHTKPTNRVPVRTCFKEGCERRLRIDNKKGACRAHFHQHPDFRALLNDRYATDETYRLGQLRRAAESYVARRDAGLPCRGETTHEMMMRGKHKRRAIEAEVFVEHVNLAELFAAHGGRCHICTEALDVADWHADHVIPIAMRGPHCWDNMAPAHPACNMSKAARRLGSPNAEVDARARAAFRRFHGYDCP